jgi:putative transposase
MYRWRAVDHEGEVLDMLVQRRRDTRTALRLMRKLLRKQDMSTMTLGLASASPVKTQLQRFPHLHARKSTSWVCSAAIWHD